MAKCMSCGKTALFTTKFGNIVLCNNCGALIDALSWNSRDFGSMEVLLEHKKDAIQKATNNNMPSLIIDEITHFFDEYINAGFITSINGKAGQTLKVFANYCIITTKNDSKKTELENMFYQFDNSDDTDNIEILSPNDKKKLVNGIMSGRLIQTGFNVAISATLNQYEKDKIVQQKSHERHKNIERLITVGDRKVDLRSTFAVETFSKPNTANGYLKFVKQGANIDTLYDCDYFFFNNSIPFESKKIRQKIESIKNLLNKKITAMEQESQRMQRSQVDVFDEIRKFKQLLDDGIISEDEFNFKKKQLLGL